MAGRKIGLTLTAKDDASKVIRDVGKTLDKVGETAEFAADDVLQHLNAALDATETELGRVRSASAALARALGPELTARNDIDGLVIELSRLGVGFEDIEAHADEFAASLKRVDDIRLNRVRSELSQVDDKVDRSRSVMANFAGNAAQDLPGIAGSFGALNVAVGQFAEYAAEGGISAKGFMSSLLPMAGIAVAIPLLTKALGGLGEEQRRIAARAKEVGDALATETQRLLEAGDAADAAAIAHLALNTALGEGEQGDEFARALVRVGVSAEDAIDAMVRLKANTAGYIEELIRSQGAWEGHEALMARAIDQGDNFEETWKIVRDGLMALGESEVTAGESARVLIAKHGDLVKSLEKLDDTAEDTDLNATIGKALEDLAIKFGDAGLAALQATRGIADPIERYGEFTRVLQDLNDETGTHTVILRGVEQSFADAADAAGEYFAGVDAAAEANRRAATAADWLADKEYEAERALREYNAAWDELTGEINAEQVLMDLQDAFAAVADTAIKEGQSVEDAMREQRREILDAKAKVIDYGREILGLPPEALTDILALIDEGKVAEAEAALTVLARDRRVRLIVDADKGLMDPTEGGGGGGGGIAPLTADERKWIAAGGGLPERFVEGKERGGPVGAGKMYEVAERGAPELLNVGGRTFLLMGAQGGTVTPASSGAGSGVAQNGGGNLIVQVAVTAPPDTANPYAWGQAVARGLIDHVRVNGPLPAGLFRAG